MQNAEKQKTLALVRMLNGLPGSAALEYEARLRGTNDDHYVTYYFVESHRELLLRAKSNANDIEERESEKNKARLKQF